MNIAALWNGLVSFVRRLPVAQYIKPIWKGGLKQAVQLGGDELQKQLDAQLEAHAEKALPKLQEAIAGLPARFSRIVAKIPFIPAALAQKAQDAVDDAVASLQARLVVACESGCAKTAQGMFDQAFDRFQVDLIARIDAL